MMAPDDTSIQKAGERRPLLDSGSSRNNVLASGSSRHSVENDEVAQRRVVKNLCLHCLSILFIFTSFMSLQNLESSLNHKAGLGVISMACLYVGLILTSLFSPIIVRYMGYKWTMVMSFAAFCIFAGANFYPKFYILGPAAVLLGLSLGPFWTAQGLFLTTLAVTYGGYAEVTASTVISRFNGMFYMFLQSCRIWGNLISSQIFISPDDVTWNVSYPINETCGAAFCGFPKDSWIPLIDAPGRTEVYTLLGVYLGCGVVGLLIKCFLVDNIPPLPQEQELHLTLGETLTSTLRIHCNGCMGLLIPLMFYNGVEQVLMFADFTQAFITCELGIGYVGYSMMTFGAVNTLSSFMMGQLEKCSGRIIMFLSAAAINLGVLLLMLEWEPGRGTEDNWVLYTIPALWAIADSIWQTTLVSLIAVEFDAERDAGFATFRFWQGAGMGSAFAYSFFVCMETKLFVMIFLLVGSMILYMVMELYMRRKMNRPYIDLYAPIIE